MKKILSVLLVIAIGCSVCSMIVSAESSLYEETDAIIYETYYPEDYIGYRYPILPGTTEWNN